MAINTIPALNEFMFASEFARFTITGVSSAVSLAIESGAKTVFSNTYIPDADGSVTIYDLDRVLDADIKEIDGKYTFKMNGSQLGATDITVIKCLAKVSEPAETFLSLFFLTPFMGERNTAMGRYETLSVICPGDAEPIIATCTYYRPDGTVSTESVTIASGMDRLEFDASPAQFAKDGEQLVGYVIECGKRRARYRVLDYVPDADPAIIYRNCFNAWETLYFTGLKEIKPAYTRAQANIGGVFRNYNIDEVVSFKASTGPLRQGMEVLLLDVARSKAVFLLNADGTAGDEITITDSDLAYNYDYRELPDLNITYRIAEKRTANVHAVVPPHLFDATFDKTYE